MRKFDAEVVRSKLWALLGDLPPLFTPQSVLLSTEEHDSYTLEHRVFENGLGDKVYGYLLIPKNIEFPAPAVLYHHVHGGKYHLGKEMILHPQRNGYADGIALVEMGFIVFAIDAYAFGQRIHQGPTGEKESGAETELSLFKQFLWAGKSLWGMMLHDDLLALAYLRSRSDVDSSRIGTTGASLGGSRSTWVAALDGNLQVVIPIIQMTRYADFAKQGDYALHSIYFYVPAMLQSGIDMEHIVAAAAPTRQLILYGCRDPLSPLSGVETILNFARATYKSHNAENRLHSISYTDVGHEYMPAMVEAMIDMFTLHL